MQQLLKLLLITLLIALTSIAMADTGEQLHQSACIDCHSRMTGGDGTVLYEREERIVQSLAALQHQTARCSAGAATGWDDAQIQSVVDYLNQSHYHF